MKMRAFYFAALLLCTGFVHAESLPSKSTVDSRLQYVPYTNDIIRIQTKVGRMLEIEFAKSETKIDFAMGDRDAWTVKTAGNVLILKPKAAFADTNLRVITNKRRYWFDLVMAPGKQPLAYHLVFQYPDEPEEFISPELVATQIAVQQKKEMDGKLREPLDAAQARTPAMEKHEPTAMNGDYGAIGPDELTPIAAYDNGEHTFVTFAPNNPLPAIFAKEKDGSESRVNFHVEPGKDGVMVVHRVARKFVLRRGSQTLCLINGSFKASGSNGVTNTISNEVRRDIKGIE
jgi:type IV secretion system protein VirB9